MRKIVVLDGYTMNPGDLSWEGFNALGETEIYNRTPGDLTLSRIGEAEFVLTNKVVLDRNIIQKAPNIRYIGVLATGYNVVDLDAATERQIVVTNVPSYSSQSVAQLVFAHILAHYNRVEGHNRYIKEGGWSRSEYDSFFITPQIELAGKTIGIVGYGNIGTRVARIAQGFDMKVLIAARTSKDHLPEGISQTSLAELFKESDIVSLNCPLTAENIRFVDHSLLGLMKQNAILINTGRGLLIHESDLVEALTKQRIAGASLDVLSVEPPPADHPLIPLENCILTSHLAWSTREARLRLMNRAVANLEAFLYGHPVNQVNR